MADPIYVHLGYIASPTDDHKHKYYTYTVDGMFYDKNNADVSGVKEFLSKSTFDTFDTPSLKLIAPANVGNNNSSLFQLIRAHIADVHSAFDSSKVTSPTCLLFHKDGCYVLVVRTGSAPETVGGGAKKGSRQGLDRLTVSELRGAARSRGIRGFSGMRKQELVDALRGRGSRKASAAARKSS